MSNGVARKADGQKWLTLNPFMIHAGTSGSPATLPNPTGSNEPISLFATSAYTAATYTLRLVDVGLTLTGASSTNTAEVIKGALTANVQIGNWANGVYGKLDFSTSGRVTGLAGAVCGEIDMPNAAGIASGSYYCFEGEMIVPTSATWAGGTHAGFMVCNVSGAGKAAFDTSGVLFEITGATSGSTKFWYDHNGTAGGDTIGEWIKIMTPNGVKYLGVYDAQH